MTTITYQVRKNDLIEFNEHEAIRNGAYGKGITRHRLIVPGIVAIIALFMVMSSQNGDLGMYFLTGAVAWSLIVPVLIKKRFHKYVSEQLSEQDLEKAVGEYRLKITDKGLLEIKPTGKTLIRWGSILKLERSKRHAYIYLNEDSAIIIPKETVSEDSDYKIFYDDLIKAFKASYSNKD